MLKHFKHFMINNEKNGKKELSSTVLQKKLSYFLKLP